MAAFLRSSKVVRFCTNIARSLTQSVVRNQAENGLLPHSYIASTAQTRFFASQNAPLSDIPAASAQSLDHALHRIDSNIRRTGRVSKRAIEEILEEIREMRTATTTQSLLVIRCCGNLVPDELPETRTKLVQEIWNTLQMSGVPLDISHHNALLRVYLENEHEFSPSEFLSELERTGVQANRVTYQRLIARYCQLGDIEGASQILSFMKDQGLPINEHIFNSLIMGHARAGDMESAKGMLSVMQQAGLEPSGDSYTTLLCGYAKYGDIQAIHKTLLECEKDIMLFDHDYMEIIYTLTVNGHAQYVDEIIPKMKKVAGYNQDMVNVIMRLINVGHEDVAYRLLLTMPKPTKLEGDNPPLGAFFLSQLVKANRPTDKILQVCRDLKEADLNQFGLLKVTESALELGQSKLAIELLEAMKKEGFPIRQHYFWPLLIRCIKNKDEQGLLDVLHHMHNLEVPINAETMREYVIPGVAGTPEMVLAKLQTIGISTASVIMPLLHHFLHRGDLKAASHLASSYAHMLGLGRTNLSTSVALRRSLMEAFLHGGGSQNMGSLVTLLRLLCAQSEAEAMDKREVVGRFLLDCLQALHRDKANMILPLIQSLLDQGLGISNSTATVLQENLGEEMNGEIATVLEKLVSGEIEEVHSQQPRGPALVLKDQSTEQLEQLLRLQESRGMPSKAVKKQLMFQYCRSKDLEKAQAMRKTLEAENFVLSGGMYALLIELYTHFDMLEEALQVMKEMMVREPDFPLDDMKIIRLVSLHVKKGLYEDGMQILCEQSREKPMKERSLVYNTFCWRMLNQLAEEGKAEVLENVFTTLKEKDFITPNSLLLAPLVKVHMVKEDLDSAMDAFQHCCEKYKCTAGKQDLMARLIRDEDPERLQRVMDLSGKIHGEVNSLYDLVFCFIECGQVRQARKIIETPGLRARHQKLEWTCKRYLEENRVAELEDLVSITRDLFDVDRNMLYLYLLKAYGKTNNVEKALGIWTSLQEEDVQPTDELLIQLAEFLQKNGREVPFVVPERKISPPVVSQETQQHVVDKNAASVTSSGPLFSSNQAEDLDAQLNTWRETLKTGSVINVKEVSQLLEGLVKASRLGEASRLTQDMLSKHTFPLPRVFRYFLGILSNAGDVETLTSMDDLITPEVKKLVSFDNRLCRAYSVAGRSKEYLEKLEAELDAADGEEALAAQEEKFPRGGIYDLIEKNPELLPQYSRLSEKFASKGLRWAQNVEWAYLLSHGEYSEADRLWSEEQGVSSMPRLMFRKVCQAARERKDEKLASTLVGLLNSAETQVTGLGIAYSAWIDVLCEQDKTEEALDVLKDALKRLTLEDINFSALQHIKNGLEKKNVQFPFQIPNKRVKSTNDSSSSSSSDSDEEKNSGGRT